MWGTKGGGGVIYTAQSCPACEGMGALVRAWGKGRNGNGGEDEEVGRSRAPSAASLRSGRS